MVGADAELTQLPRFHRSVNPGVGINTTILLELRTAWTAQAVF